MVFIFLIFVVLFLHKARISNKLSIFLIVMLASIVFANRSLSVPDTIQYVEIFEGENGHYEVGYTYICDLLRNFGFSFSSFILLISFVGLVIWFHITAKVVDKKSLLLSFVVYMSYMGIYYHGIVLRACLAILINYVGIYYGIVKNKNYTLFYICNCASLLFHISAILFAPLPLLIRRRYSSKFLYAVLIGAFLFMLLNNSTTFITNILTTIMDRFYMIGGARLGSYIQNTDIASIGLTDIKYLFTGLFLIFMSQFIRPSYARKETFTIYFNIYIVGLVMLFLLSFAPGSARIAQLFLFFEFLPFTLLYEGIYRSKKKYIKLFLIVLVITNFFSLVRLVPELWNYCS